MEREDEEDIGSEPSFIGGDIVNTYYDWGSVTFNSVYTRENFDLTQEFNYTLNITLDLKKVLGLYGNTRKSKEKIKIFGIKEHCITELLKVVIG